jgi:hypothetical protein
MMNFRCKKQKYLMVLALVACICRSGRAQSLLPDNADVYTSCPACDTSYRSDTLLDENRTDASMAVVQSFVDAIMSQKPEDVVKLFCPNGILWGTVSHHARYTEEEIYSYFDYFARQDNNILSVCPQVISLADDLTKVNVAVNNSNRCLRMSFSIDVGDECIMKLYSSYFPNDPEDLRVIDQENQMPWSDIELNNGTVTDPNTDLGDCKACDLTVRGDIAQKDVDGVQSTLTVWVTGLLEQNETQVMDSYCNDPFLWGTVTNFRRNTYDQVKSYFEWFANSRNFSEEIKSVCPTLSQISESLFVEDRELRLGQQCLRMSYTLIKNNSNPDTPFCIKGLSSSYFPTEPEGLVMADAKNLGPTPAPPSGNNNKLTINAMVFMVLIILS